MVETVEVQCSSNSCCDILSLRGVAEVPNIQSPFDSVLARLTSRDQEVRDLIGLANPDLAVQRDLTMVIHARLYTTIVRLITQSRPEVRRDQPDPHTPHLIAAFRSDPTTGWRFAHYSTQFMAERFMGEQPRSMKKDTNDWIIRIADEWQAATWRPL